MKGIDRITVTESVALVTLHNSPSDIHFIADAFDLIASAGINVDMISQTAPLGSEVSISFTVADDDIGTVLNLSSKKNNNSLQVKYPNVKTVVSQGNVKISLYSDNMRDTPGIASHVFQTVADCNADIRLITTSEVDISILVPQSELTVVLEILQK